MRSKIDWTKLVLKSIILLGTTLQFQSAAADDWPQWRGSGRNGTTPGNELIKGDSRLEVLWKRPLGIGGYSSVSVSNGYIYTTFSDSQNDYAICLSAVNGDEVWRFSIDKAFPGRGGADAGPLSTPAIANGKVFVLSPYGSFYGLTAQSGKMLWKVDIVKELGGSRPEFGFTSSPLILGKEVVLQVGGNNKNTLVCFKAENGKVKWTSYVDRVEYASPSLLELAGQRQIVSRTNSYTYALLPQTGEVLWQAQEFLGSQSHATPFAISDREVLVVGFERSLLLKVDRKAGRFVAENIWSSRELRGNFSEPVFKDGFLYGYNAAFVTCVDARNGKVVWKSREPGDSSLILAGDYLVIFTSNGKLFLAIASPAGLDIKTGLQVLDARSISPPSYSNGYIYVRSLRGIATVAITK